MFIMIYKSENMYGVCKVCGCTEKDPCYHPEYGFCWWANDNHDLCSHCAEIGKDPATVHCVNTKGKERFQKLYGVRDLSEECWNCRHMNQEENECMVTECDFEPKGSIQDYVQHFDND